MREDDRIIGSLLGGMCGDILGAAVEGLSYARITYYFPNGMTEFQHTNRGFGNYSDDSQMVINTIRSLVRKGFCDAEDASRAYAENFDANRGYGETAAKILRDLQNGADYRTSGTKYFPEGSWANGGAMRIAPVACAYKNAGPVALHRAVTDALLCTHTHPSAIDAAYVQATAIAWLTKSRVDSFDPDRFLYWLANICKTTEMREKIVVVRDVVAGTPGLSRTEPVTSWSEYFASDAWRSERATCSRVSDDFQIRATDAVASALVAFCFHWRSPRDAVVAAVHQGGDTDTVATMVGSLVGALQGHEWIPRSWWDNIEDRDHVIAFARRLPVVA